VIALPTFPSPDPANPENERQFREMVARTFQQFARELGGGPPEVSTSFERTGSVMTVTHTITDPSRSFLSMEFQYNGGGWLTTWDTAVVGSSYVEDVTLTPGTDAIYEYRLGYANANGARKYKQQAFNLADLQSVTKRMTIPPTFFLPQNETTPWSYTGGYLKTNSTAGNFFYYASIPMPVGVTIEAFRARLTRLDVADTIAVDLYADPTDVPVPIASVDHNSGTGAVTLTDSTVSHLVTTQEPLVLLVEMGSTLGIANVGLIWCEIEYTAPSYDKTY
jgi:hypothetical protein